MSTPKSRSVWCTDSHLAYPASFENEEAFPFFDGTEQKVARPLSAPGSPRDRTGMMTPGDFPSLQEGMENLDTDDYVGWRLPSAPLEESEEEETCTDGVWHGQ